MNERDIIDAYARELKLAAVRENVALLAEDAVREQWGHLTFLRRLLEEGEVSPLLLCPILSLIYLSGTTPVLFRTR